MTEYASLDTIKSRTEYNKDDFDLTTSGFENLLEQLEDEGSSIINSYKGDITFNKETGKTQEFKATSHSNLQLEYPVIDVSTVEYKRPSIDYKTLDSNRYSFTEHNLILRKYPRNFVRTSRNVRMTPLVWDTSRLEWSDFASKVKVTYDRGFDPLPQNIINIEIDLIRKMLRKFKLERSVQNYNPEEISQYTTDMKLMTEDLEKRLDSITDTRNFVRSI